MDKTNNIYSKQKMEGLILNNKENKFIVIDDISSIIGPGEVDFEAIMKEG